MGVPLIVVRTGVTVLGLPFSLTVTQGSRAVSVALGCRLGAAETRDSKAVAATELDARIVAFVCLVVRSETRCSRLREDSSFEVQWLEGLKKLVS